MSYVLRLSICCHILLTSQLGQYWKQLHLVKVWFGIFWHAFFWPHWLCLHVEVNFVEFCSLMKYFQRIYSVTQTHSKIMYTFVHYFVGYNSIKPIKILNKKKENVCPLFMGCTVHTIMGCSEITNYFCLLGTPYY